MRYVVFAATRDDRVRDIANIRYALLACYVQRRALMLSLRYILFTPCHAAALICHYCHDIVTLLTLRYMPLPLRRYAEMPPLYAAAASMIFSPPPLFRFRAAFAGCCFSSAMLYAAMPPLSHRHMRHKMRLREWQQCYTRHRYNTSPALRLSGWILSRYVVLPIIARCY